MTKNTDISNRENNILIGNHRLELGFDQQHHAALVSMVDKNSGWEFVRDTTAPLKTLFPAMIVWRRNTRSFFKTMPCNIRHGKPWTDR